MKDLILQPGIYYAKIGNQKVELKLDTLPPDKIGKGCNTWEIVSVRHFETGIECSNGKYLRQIEGYIYKFGIGQVLLNQAIFE